MTSPSNQLSHPDDLLDQAIAEYLREESAGTPHSRQWWINRFPLCAGELAEFLDDHERFDRLVNPIRQDWLQLTPEPADASKPGKTGNADTVDFGPSPPHFVSNRYATHKFHARGGMGEVWLGEDLRIGRQVAIKKIRSGREQRQEARFLVEAQVTGQLEHPGVVPLHDLGIDDAGQPFYVVKFIHGRKLSDVIAEYHATTPRVDLCNDLPFRRLLESYVSICQVIAYAHSKRVLHRDIKPENVMLGPFGETLVLDWGLAKVMDQPDQGHSAVRLSGGASGVTQDGAIVGSPFYMSPEVAEGHLDAVDASSDVYSLGATLYELLTARPPRQGTSQLELIDLARKSRPTPPRSLIPAIPRALEAICLKAMAFRKSDRYSDPLALAHDIERYLAGESTAALPDNVRQRAWRWMRRHRRRLLKSAAVVGMAMLGLLTISMYRNWQHLAAREEAQQRIAEFERLADEAQFYAASTDPVGEVAPYYRPERGQQLAMAALAITDQWGSNLELLPLPDRREKLVSSEYNLLLLLVQIELRAPHAGGKPQAALQYLERARGLNQPPSRGYRELRELYFTRFGDESEARRERDRATSEQLACTAQDYFIRGELLRTADRNSGGAAITADVPPDRGQLSQAIDCYRAALRLEPQYYWAQFQLGRCLMAIGKRSEAVEALSACIALRPGAPWGYSTRGLAEALCGNFEEAFADLNRAIEVGPRFLPARLNRGIAHWLNKDLENALADFVQVLAAPSDRRLIEAAFYRGQVFLSQREHRKAIADYSTVLESRSSFRPAVWQRAIAEFQTGDVSAALADINSMVALEAESSSTPISAFGKGKLLHQIALQLDGDARAQALAMASEQLRTAANAMDAPAEVHQRLGAVLQTVAKSDEALEAYTRGIKAFPEDVSLYNRRGWAHQALEQTEQAREDFETALRLDPNDAEAHTGLGFILAGSGAAAEARNHAATALLHGDENYLVLHNAACIYAELSQSSAEAKTGDEDLAIAMLKRAVVLARSNPAGPDECQIIRGEAAFPSSLRSRIEFQSLVSGCTP